MSTSPTAGFRSYLCWKKRKYDEGPYHLSGSLGTEQLSAFPALPDGGSGSAVVVAGANVGHPGKVSNLDQSLCQLPAKTCGTTKVLYIEGTDARLVKQDGRYFLVRFTIPKRSSMGRDLLNECIGRVS